MSSISFRNHRLAALDFGDLKERREDAKRGDIMGYLVWEPDMGEGEVVLIKQVDDYSWLSMLEMMSDWVRLLQREYDTVRSKDDEPQ